MAFCKVARSRTPATRAFNIAWSMESMGSDDFCIAREMMSLPSPVIVRGDWPPKDDSISIRPFIFMVPRMFAVSKNEVLIWVPKRSTVESASIFFKISKSR